MGWWPDIPVVLRLTQVSNHRLLRFGTSLTARYGNEHHASCCGANECDSPHCPSAGGGVRLDARFERVVRLSALDNDTEQPVVFASVTDDRPRRAWSENNFDQPYDLPSGHIRVPLRVDAVRRCGDIRVAVTLDREWTGELDVEPHVLVVLAGVLLLGGGIVACGSDDDASEVPSGVTSTLEALTEATNTYDTEAFGALLTEDFTWQSTGPVVSGTQLLAYIDSFGTDPIPDLVEISAYDGTGFVSAFDCPAPPHRSRDDGVVPPRRDDRPFAVDAHLSGQRPLARCLRRSIANRHVRKVISVRSRVDGPALLRRRCADRSVLACDCRSGMTVWSADRKRRQRTGGSAPPACRSEGRMASTIGRRPSTLSSCHKYCQTEDILDANPALNVRRPKVHDESRTLGLDRNELGDQSGW